jgi:N-acetylglucosamine kinase-like BadF-type ATPase
MMKTLVLGIDGGGSKTLACLADRDGRVLMAARGAGSAAMDNPRWQQNVGDVLQPMRGHLADVGFATFSAGSYREVPRIDTIVDAGVKQLLPGVPHEIENDVFVANDAAFLGGAGVLLIAGTGSMAVAHDGHGTYRRVGGWGHIIGDEGSAYWLGREALGLASQSLDGRRPAPEFADTIVRAIGAEGDPVAGILDWVTRMEHQRSLIASLAVHVEHAAAAGDATAIALLDAGIDHLNAHFSAARRIAGLPDAPWGALGGVASSPLVIAGLTKRQGTPMTPPKLPPVGGALARAARRLGWPVDNGWADSLAESLEHMTVQTVIPNPRTVE